MDGHKRVFTPAFATAGDLLKLSLGDVVIQASHVHPRHRSRCRQQLSAREQSAARLAQHACKLQQTALNSAQLHRIQPASSPGTPSDCLAEVYCWLRGLRLPYAVQHALVLWQRAMLLHVTELAFAALHSWAAEPAGCCHRLRQARWCL